VFLKLGPLIMRKISVGVGGEDAFLMWAFTLSPVAFLCTLEGADRNAGKRGGRMFLGGCDCEWVSLLRFFRDIHWAFFFFFLGWS